MTSTNSIAGFSAEKTTEVVALLIPYLHGSVVGLKCSTLMLGAVNSVIEVVLNSCETHVQTRPCVYRFLGVDPARRHEVEVAQWCEKCYDRVHGGWMATRRCAPAVVYDVLGDFIPGGWVVMPRPRSLKRRRDEIIAGGVAM